MVLKRRSGKASPSMVYFYASGQTKRVICLQTPSGRTPRARLGRCGACQGSKPSGASPLCALGDPPGLRATDGPACRPAEVEGKFAAKLTGLKCMHGHWSWHLVNVVQPRSAVDMDLDAASGRTFHGLKRVLPQRVKPGWGLPGPDR